MLVSLHRLHPIPHRKSKHMKIENQVCSIEQAKLLKSLGIEQESLFFWYNQPHDNGKDEYWETEEVAYRPWFVNASYPEDESEGCTYYAHGTEQYSAFTVSELAAMIGKGTNAASLLYDAVQSQMNRSHSFTICYSPEFLANCVISMLQTGRITAEEINERLKEK
jgi:hypothetical protein